MKDSDATILYEHWLLEYKKGDADKNATATAVGSRLLAQSQITELMQMWSEMTLDPLVLLPPAIGKETLPLLQDVVLDLDGFFDEYPECARIPPIVGDDDFYEPDADDSRISPTSITSMRAADNAVAAARKIQHEQKYHQEEDEVKLDRLYKQAQQAVAQQTPDVVAVNVNPYARSVSHHQQQQQLPNSSNGRHHHQRPNSSNGRTKQQPHNSGSRRPQPPPAKNAWEAHTKNQNPFQSAREYAWADDQAQQTQQQQQHNSYQQHKSYQQQNQQPPYHQHHQQQTNNPYQTTTTMTNNPYQTQQVVRSSSLSSSSPPPAQPAIRESLKRKFQPPVKRSAAAERPSSRGNNKGNGTQRTKGSGGEQHKKDSGNADADDLPEELKRFGKDLVEKIENEIMESGDSISFEQIAGLADQKQTVQEVVCWPMKRPDLFTGLRRAPNGLLLYGPPGTGKTLIGKAIAHESGATFFSISSSSLTSKWIGEGEKLVRTLFAVAAYRQPAVVFIDEIDSLLTQRKSDDNEASRRIKTEFLVQLDGTGTTGQGRVLVIGATNRPQELDEAARRRFTKRLYIPLPETDDREILLRVLLNSNKHKLTEQEVRKLAIETAGYSGADIKALSTDAAMGPIRQLGPKALEVNVANVPPISYKHFRQALRGMRPSVAPADLEHYIEWDATYGSKRVEDEEDSDDCSTCGSSSENDK